MDDWKLLEYLVGGSLVIIGLVIAFVALSFAAMVLLPFAIGYLIVLLIWRAYDAIFPEQYSRVQPITPEEAKRMSIQLDEERKLHEAKLELERLQSEQARLAYEEQIASVEAVEDSTVILHKKKVKEEPEEEFTLNRNFYVERKLSHKEKEALFAHGYSRLKVSPDGESGSAYYWVKTRYNESKEHAFFCYLIEKELHKYTTQVDLFVNSGPDVIVRHGGQVYAFDVETGKNLIRKPEETKAKFERYKNDYFRSYVFVTSKSLKRKYHKLGIVITRSTFKKVISDIFY